MSGIRDQTPYEQARQMIDGALGAGRTALGEFEAKALLKMYGVPVPIGAVALNEEEATNAAEQIGRPVAMKAVGADIHHKT